MNVQFRKYQHKRCLLLKFVQYARHYFGGRKANLDKWALTQNILCLFSIMAGTSYLEYRKYATRISDS